MASFTDTRKLLWADHNETTSYVGMDAYFFDTFYITGTDGQEGQFQINMSFTGDVTTNCAAVNAPPPDCQIDDQVNTFNLLENGTVIPGQEYSGIIATIHKTVGSPKHQTMSVTIYLSAGSSVVLGELLQLRNYIQNEGSSGEMTFTGNHSGQKTAFVTVASLTPGFAFTTASGLTYAEIH
jgi:hypothetical protein